MSWIACAVSSKSSSVTHCNCVYQPMFRSMRVLIVLVIFAPPTSAGHRDYYKVCPFFERKRDCLTALDRSPRPSL